MRKLNIMFLGCGFLATHLIPHVLPFSEHVYLVDRERVERVNYDNSIYPKHFVNKRKVSALAGLIQVLSSVPVTPIHSNIKSYDQLSNLLKDTEPDIIFVTFDNVKSRLIARNTIEDLEMEAIHIGVTENYVYVDWNDFVILPETDEEVERVENELRRIRDVCTRIEFRGLGVLAAGYAYYSFKRWLDAGEKLAFIVMAKDEIRNVCLRR